MQFIISVNIKWSNLKFGNIYLSNGIICMSGDDIEVKGEISHKDSNKIVLAYPAHIDIYADLEKNITYSDARVDGTEVILDVSEAHIVGFSMSTLNGKTIMSWNLSTLKYYIKTDDERDKFLLGIPYIHLFRQIKKLENFADDFEFVYEGDRYEFYSYGSSACTLVRTNANEKNAKVLFTYMAFFFNSPMEILARTSKLPDGMSVVLWNTPRFDFNKETLYHPELVYMNFGGCDNTLADFVQNSAWGELEDNKQENLKQAVYTFARSKTCDDTMQFLSIYSILDRYVGNRKGNSHARMTEKFTDYQININKIGKSTDSTIKQLQLVLERENGLHDVQNFCELRDYILHFMTTPDIDMFLVNSELLSRMRFAAVIIMLHEFGFKNPTFKKEWKHLSILSR